MVGDVYAIGEGVLITCKKEIKDKFAEYERRKCVYAGYGGEGRGDAFVGNGKGKEYNEYARKIAVEGYVARIEKGRDICEKERPRAHICG